MMEAMESLLARRERLNSYLEEMTALKVELKRCLARYARGTDIWVVFTVEMDGRRTRAKSQSSV